MQDPNRLRSTRVALDRALNAARLSEADRLLGELGRLDPANPRWPHKRGDLLRKLGKNADAIANYEAAVSAYAEQGFIARAIAMAKTVLSMDGSRIDVLERVDPTTAQRMRDAHKTAKRGSSIPAPLPPRAAPPPLPELAKSARPASPPPVGEPIIELELADLYSVAPQATQDAVVLSDNELQPRKRSSEFEELFEEAPSADALAELPLFPLFADVPKELLAQLTTSSELIELVDGALVMRKGERGDAMYGIVEGCVEMIVPGTKFRLVLAEGDVFGETCLLEDEKRRVDARVVGKLTALRMPRAVMVGLLHQHPPLGESLIELLTRRLLSNLVQTSELFQKMSPPARREVTRLFEVRRVPAGTLLATVGRRIDALYITLTGTLALAQPGAPERIAPPGSMFGQLSLLNASPSQTDIKARTNLIVLRLAGSAFMQLAMQFPAMLATVSELSLSDVVSVHR